MEDLPETMWPVSDRQQVREAERTRRRLARLDLANPQAVAAAFRRAEGHFWGAFAMGRHVHRAQVASRSGDLLPAAAFTSLMHIPRVDAILSQFGEVWSLAPDGWILKQHDWPAHVQWGADRYVEVARHLGAGRSIAAAVIARSQLERWTINVASHHGVEAAASEGTADWITRVWRTYERIEIDMGLAWSDLSEFLHGRALSDRLL